MRLGQITAAVVIAAFTLTAACAQGNLPAPVMAAVADLAARVGVAQDTITVASIEEVTWPDASLGNPQPGNMYAQVLTPGYRVFLMAAGERYEYHTDMGTSLTLIGAPADAGDAVEAGPQQETLQRIGLILAAKRDLAGRLGVDFARIYLASVEQRTWPSSALGIEVPGQAYADVLTPGYKLIFEAGGKLYDYHTDLATRIKPAILAGGGEGAAIEQTPLIDWAVADLAARLNVAADAITVVGAEDVQWTDGSLGLPEPGMVYTKAIVSGQRITLQAQGRNFAYHAAGAPPARYAGVVYADDAQVSVLAMARTEPADGNNFFHLVRIEPQTGQRDTVVEFVSSFATTPDGRDVLIKRRTSRSGHLVAHVAADGTVTELARAFDFHAMALRADGSMAAYWSRRSIGERTPILNIRAQPWDAGETIAPDLSGLPAGFSAGDLVWTDSGLAFTAYTDAGARAFYWTPGDGLSELGAFEVMGWVPRTRALLVKREEGGQATLASFIPGMGEIAALTSAPQVQSVAAPVGQNWIVGIVSGGGQPELQTITWGGVAERVAVVGGTDWVRVAISPVGRTAVVEYMLEDVTRVDVLDLTGDQTTMQTLEDATGATPVAD